MEGEGGKIVVGGHTSVKPEALDVVRVTVPVKLPTALRVKDVVTAVAPKFNLPGLSLI